MNTGTLSSKTFDIPQAGGYWTAPSCKGIGGSVVDGYVPIPVSIEIENQPEYANWIVQSGFLRIGRVYTVAPPSWGELDEADVTCDSSDCVRGAETLPWADWVNDTSTLKITAHCMPDLANIQLKQTTNEGSLNEASLVQVIDPCDAGTILVGVDCWIDDSGGNFRTLHSPPKEPIGKGVLSTCPDAAYCEWGPATFQASPDRTVFHEMRAWCADESLLD